MSAADTIQLALHHYHRREADPHGTAVEVLARYDAARRAEVLAEDGQAYNGELAMLRGLVATLKAVTQNGDLSDVEKLLREYAADDAAARESDSAPTFFQPGHTYTRSHHGDTIRFVVEHVSTSPDGNFRVAHGWRTRSWDPGWEPSDSDDLTGWTDLTEGEAADV